MVLRQLKGLSLDESKDAEFHDRALHLLYRARFGPEMDYARILPHIDCNNLDIKVINAMKEKMRLD